MGMVYIMFRSIEKLIADNAKGYGPFKQEDIAKTEYYLTSPSDELDSIVKLGAKITLKDGTQYGNVIPIPWHMLKEFVKRYE